METNYTGHRHQVRFEHGRTYGELTHRVSQNYEFPNRHREPGESTDEATLVNKLPDPTGDNKLTKYMKSGYSGYIPLKKFKHGKTYQKMCDISIDQHLTNYCRTMEFEKCMLNVAKSFPKFRALNFDPDVRDHLNTYRDTHPIPPVLADSKRGFLEPPMRTWDGFVPRIQTTDAGLGLNYREASRRGFARFAHEIGSHFEILQLPVNVHCSPSSVPRTESPACKRIYLNDGMIPRWSGFIPGKQEEFGRTYGDGTRSLDACSHNEECYGEYKRISGPTPSIVIS